MYGLLQGSWLFDSVTNKMVKKQQQNNGLPAIPLLDIPSYIYPYIFLNYINIRAYL